MYDLGVVGAGPAGYTAALCAARKGQKVVIFEKDEIGGTCLNKGCIPTKAILKSSQMYKLFKNSSNYGIKVKELSYNYCDVLEKKDNIIQVLRKGIEQELKMAKVDIVKQFAQVISSDTIQAEDESTYKCKKIICAIGSDPSELNEFKFDGEFILSSDDVLNLSVLPERILIIGTGAIGVEWARIFSNFDVETTVIEWAENLLPIADIEVSKRLEREFKSNKIKFYKKTCVKEIKNKKVILSNGEEVFPEKILVAIGRKPKKTDIIKGVDYIGDVTGQIQLAHFATKQAFEKIANIPMRKDLIPSVVYGYPEIAWIGKREQDLSNENYQKSVVLFSSLGKSWCDRETDGVVKIISQNDKIVGAHIIGAEASSLVAVLTIAIQKELSIEEMKQICFAHPTYSEGIFNAIMKL